MNTATKHDPSELKETLEELVLVYRLLDVEGHGDMTQGHVALRDPQGRGLWLKQTGIGFNEVYRLEDLVLIDFEGQRLEGNGGVHGEWPIHSEIMIQRPDVNVTVHTHPFYASTFAARTDPLKAIGHEASLIKGPIGRFTETANLIFTKEEGQAVAAALGDADAVFMRNHGVTFCGPNLGYAFLVGVFLEKACKAQLLLEASGAEWDTPDEEEDEAKRHTIMTQGFIDNSYAYYQRQLARRETRNW